MNFLTFPNASNNMQKEYDTMRNIFICAIVFLAFIPLSIVKSYGMNEEQSIIIEIEGDPHEHRKHIEIYYPFVEIVAIYDELFNGIALKATERKLVKLSSADFIKAVHPVYTYEAMTDFRKELDNLQTKSNENVVFPAQINNTNYTGKGVKVGVIDTGIDYTHPDLASNYRGGYDLVDLDDDPMETLPNEGIPTIHGTHVAGIIAANGNLQGVAPDAQLFAYRALGPGGSGTSIQIIAAMEQAVKDHMDVINLSLGNSINGPDFPTSMAVNKAVELGIAVVIANGNSGPNKWTVGSPATATNALAVGAKMNEQLIPFLNDRLANKSIQLNMMAGSEQWNLMKDYQLVQLGDHSISPTGKIAITKRGETSFYDKAKQAEEEGAVALLIYNNEDDSFFGSIEHDHEPILIPVASISQEDGHWLLEKTKNNSYFMNTDFHKMSSGIAPFSSRGPVTISWDIKPDLLAPGTNVISTVPNGYELLQGTSMAAPHVAGAIAVIKEAHPHWTNEQIVSALKTTANRLKTEDDVTFDPIIQGMGEIQLQKAIETTTLIDHSLLSFGKLTNFKEVKTIDLTIENLTNKPKKYTFDIPKKTKGITLNLPKSFIVEGKSRKTIPIELQVMTSLLDEGVHQGWVTLSEPDETYKLPYLFVNQTADYPKAMGFDFSLKPFTEDVYQYQVYVTEPVVRMDVQLINPNSLMYERTFLNLTKLEVGMNEGEIKKTDIGERGHYHAIITVLLESGEYDSYVTELYID